MSWWVGFFQNLGAGFVSAIVLYLLINLVGDELDESVQKRNLILQLASESNERAREAIRILWAKGWLQDGSLRGADLTQANLQSADFGVSDLRNIVFRRANLVGATVWADVRGANFEDADLEGATFVRPPFPKSSNAIRIPDAYSGQYPEQAIFDQTTIMPDGERWSLEEHGYYLTKFTGRYEGGQTADIWRSEKLQSPAYFDKEELHWYAALLAQKSDILDLSRKIDDVISILSKGKSP